MSLLTLCLFFPSFASAQPQSSCHLIRQRIHQITSTEAVLVTDSLHMVLDLAALFRECEQEVSPEKEVWLLTAEVFVLDKLERYDEAKTLVDRFFDAFFTEASKYYRARFYNWRLHLGALTGEVRDVVAAYTDAQQYAEALDPINHAHLHLNGAYAYRKIGEYGTALSRAQEAKALIGRPKAYDDSLVLARAIHSEAESRLRRRTELNRVKEDLQVALGLFDALGNTSKVAAVTALLGEAYAAEGDTSLALAQIATGVALARKSGVVRSVVYALYRQGQLLRRSGALDDAEPLLLEAFEATKTHREFALIVAYELARLYEKQREPDQVAHFYRIVVNAPKSASLSSIIEAEIKAEKAEARLMLLEAKRRLQQVLYAGVGSIILLLVLGGAGSLFLRQRYKPPKPPLVVEKATGGVHIIPTNLPTGLSLDQLKQRFQHKMEAERAGRCWTYAYATLLDPDLVLPYLQEGAQADAPWLADLIAHVEADSLPNNRVLHRCVIAVETAVDGETFGKNPENTMLRLFQRECDKRGWTYPTHPTEWKRHFIEHHLDILFERSGTSRPTAFWPGLRRLRALKEKAMFLMIG